MAAVQETPEITSPYYSTYFKDLTGDTFLVAENLPDYDGKDRPQLVQHNADGRMYNKKNKLMKKPNIQVPVVVGYNTLGPDGDSHKSWRINADLSDLLQTCQLHFTDVNEKVLKKMKWVGEDISSLQETLETWQNKLLDCAWDNCPAKEKKKKFDNDKENFLRDANKGVVKELEHYNTKEREATLFVKKNLYTKKDSKYNGVRIWKKTGDDTYERVEVGKYGLPTGTVAMVTIQLAFYKTSTMFGTHAKLGSDIIILKMGKVNVSKKKRDRIEVLTDSEDEEHDMKRLRTDEE